MPKDRGLRVSVSPRQRVSLGIAKNNVNFEVQLKPSCPRAKCAPYLATDAKALQAAACPSRRPATAGDTENRLLVREARLHLFPLPSCCVSLTASEAPITSALAATRRALTCPPTRHSPTTERSLHLRGVCCGRVHPCFSQSSLVGMDMSFPAPAVTAAGMLLAGAGFFLSVVSALLNAILGRISPMRLDIPPPALPKTLSRRKRLSRQSLTPRTPSFKSGSSGSSTAVPITPPDLPGHPVQIANADNGNLSPASALSPSKIPLRGKVVPRRRRKGPVSPSTLTHSAPTTPLEELTSMFELTPPTPPSRAMTLTPNGQAPSSPFSSDECLVVEVQQTRSFTMSIRRALGGEKGQKPPLPRTTSTPQVPRASTVLGSSPQIPRRKSCPDNKDQLSRSLTMSAEAPPESPSTTERRSKSPFGGRKPQPQRKRTLPYEAPYFAPTPVPPLPRSKTAVSPNGPVRRPQSAGTGASP